MSPSCIQNLKTLAQIEAEKSVTENFVRDKEKWTNKGTDKPYVADFFFYTVQPVIPDVCTKFQILGQVVPEIFDENFHIYYFGVRD